MPLHGQLFPISSKSSFICATDKTAHNSVYIPLPLGWHGPLFWVGPCSLWARGFGVVSLMHTAVLSPTEGNTQCLLDENAGFSYWGKHPVPAWWECWVLLLRETPSACLMRMLVSLHCTTSTDPVWYKNQLSQPMLCTWYIKVWYVLYCLGKASVKDVRNVETC